MPRTSAAASRSRLIASVAQAVEMVRAARARRAEARPAEAAQDVGADGPKRASRRAAPAVTAAAIDSTVGAGIQAPPRSTGRVARRSRRKEVAAAALELPPALLPTLSTRSDLDLESERPGAAHGIQPTEPGPRALGRPAGDAQRSVAEANRARRETQAKAAFSEADRQRLWRAYRRRPGDQTRNRLVEAYQFLIKEIVGRFAARLPRSVDRGDLSTAANMGLMAAIQSFDGSRGVRFEVYGDRRIRGALLDELRTQDWLPRLWRRRIESHKQAIEQLCAQLGREPDDTEIAQALGLSLEDYLALFGMAWPLAPAGSGGAEQASSEYGPELDVVPDPRSLAPGEALTREELLSLCAQRMSPQEHEIVRLKYWDELSLREIGERTGLSESRISKIHTRLLERLAERLSAHAEGL